MDNTSTKWKCYNVFKFQWSSISKQARTNKNDFKTLIWDISEVTSHHVISRTGWQASKQIVWDRGPIWRKSSNFRAMVNFCAVLGCSNRSNREKDKGYYRIPQSCRDRSPKSKLWASNVERLGSPVLEGDIHCCWRYWILQSLRWPFYIRYVTWCKAQFARYIVRFLLLFLN